ncbi:PilZ domain-containing protein [Oceanidesulfovibrio marinus]|uniref:PilZ domain-containing protein n=1 Tax=Oceanidesulfovibrio marinus TaxID=370038 RepID=A0ABX6NDV5_9BACT|nr:PilZ domain-containing protein [Oceanidesulfovibrio marinus]QJT07977.1 PilZ domain-containing protein [Oceanidesulfovibrio marinus]
MTERRKATRHSIYLPALLHCEESNGGGKQSRYFTATIVDISQVGLRLSIIKDHSKYIDTDKFKIYFTAFDNTYMVCSECELVYMVSSRRKMLIGVSFCEHNAALESEIQRYTN